MSSLSLKKFRGLLSISWSNSTALDRDAHFVERQSLQSLRPTNMKIFLVLALVVLTSSSAFECPEADVVMGYPDYWFDMTPYVASWEDCGGICALTTNCNFWSFGVGSCYLYETDTGLVFDGLYVSGERGCPEDQCLYTEEI